MRGFEPPNPLSGYATTLVDEEHGVYDDDTSRKSDGVTDW